MEKVNDPETASEPRAVPRRHFWWRVLLLGLAAYAAGIAILLLTGNPNVFPTVIMIGSFLVPVTYVTFFYERRHLVRVKMPSTALTFLYGGILGTFAASLLEPLFIQHLTFETAFVVGLIEEFAKILGVLLIARRMRHDSELDGLILGAAAGMGFAAFESTGYAFVAFVRGGGVSSAVAVTMLRGLLSPLGHGTWTAIFASLMFRESTAKRFVLNGRVLLAYLSAVVLHGLWDGIPGVLAPLVPSGIEVLVAQLVVGAAGLFILWRRWREAVGFAREKGSADVIAASAAAAVAEAPENGPAPVGEGEPVHEPAPTAAASEGGPSSIEQR